MVLSTVFGDHLSVRYIVPVLIHALFTLMGFVLPRRNPFLYTPTITRRFVLLLIIVYIWNLTVWWLVAIIFLLPIQTFANCFRYWMAFGAC